MHTFHVIPYATFHRGRDEITIFPTYDELIQSNFIYIQLIILFRKTQRHHNNPKMQTSLGNFQSLKTNLRIMKCNELQQISTHYKLN